MAAIGWGTSLFGVGPWMRTLERYILTFIRVNKTKECTMGGNNTGRGGLRSEAAKNLMVHADANPSKMDRMLGRCRGGLRACLLAYFATAPAAVLHIIRVVDTCVCLTSRERRRTVRKFPLASCPLTPNSISVATQPNATQIPVLTQPIRRFRETISPELFDMFVASLKRYRAQQLAIDQLVEAVGECFDDGKVRY